jgi:ribosomal protein L36
MKQNVKGHDAPPVTAARNSSSRCPTRPCARHPPRGHGQGIDETIERLGRVTISIGVALLLVPTDTSQSLIERADNCLYVAKRQGRDRVICETDPEANRAPILKPDRLPGWCSHHCQIARASLAGSSWTDSPQPQAEVWFGLLNTN